MCPCMYVLVSSPRRRGDALKSFMDAVDPRRAECCWRQGEERRGVYRDRSYSSSRGGCRRNEWF